MLTFYCPQTDFNPSRIGLTSECRQQEIPTLQNPTEAISLFFWKFKKIIIPEMITPLRLARID